LNPAPFLTKSELRRSLLQTRQALSAQEWREKSDRLVSHLQILPLFTQAQSILAYFSFRQEPDLSSLFANGKQWGFPRIIGKSLSWHQWQPGEPWQTGAYKIPEPHPDAPILNPSEVDLILVPAVAGDAFGYRLGYGGGYYDRMLTNFRVKSAIAIVFDFGYFDQLPIDDWDRPLDGVCTENGYYDQKNSQSS
jgi:5-formyltetrahydrofolate cyclo-ligase